MTVDKKKTKVDVSQYENVRMNLDSSQAVVTNYTALLQQLAPKEAGARKMLGLGEDAPADERIRAEAILHKCAEERNELEAASERVGRRIAEIKAQLAPMEAEVERQKRIRSVAAALR